MTDYFDEHMLIEQPDETPEHLLARYEQQARAWRHRQRIELNESAAMFAGDVAHMLEQLTSALSAALGQTRPTREQIAEVIRNRDWDSLGDWQAESEPIKDDYRKNADAVLTLLNGGDRG